MSILNHSFTGFYITTSKAYVSFQRASVTEGYSFPDVVSAL